MHWSWIGIGVGSAIVGVLLTSMPQAETSQARQGRTEVSRPEPLSATADTILVGGLPSVVEYAPRFVTMLGAREESRCWDFWVRAFEGKVTQLQLTTAGMGDARLMSLQDGNTGRPRTPNGVVCRHAERGARVLTLLNVDARERRVRIVVPADVFPRASSAAGRLVVLRAGKPAQAVPINLQRATWGPFVRGGLWFLGIAVPAGLTTLLGLWVFRTQKSAEASASEAAAFSRFQKEEAAELKGFFEGLYKNTVGVADDAEYAATMERELAAKRILSELPRTARERVVVALRERDRSKVSEALADAFPEFKGTIRQAANGSP